MNLTEPSSVRSGRDLTLDYLLTYAAEHHGSDLFLKAGSARGSFTTVPSQTHHPNSLCDIASVIVPENGMIVPAGILSGVAGGAAKIGPRLRVIVPDVVRTTIELGPASTD